MSTTNEKGLVSVILPAYNGCKYIEESISSVLNQKNVRLELLIVDDHSTDTTADVVRGIHDNRVRYVKNNKQLGLNKTLNRGIGLARGQYIARIDQDDMWHDDKKLCKQVLFLEQHLNTGLLGTQARIVSPSKQFMYELHYPTTDRDLRNTMLYRNQFVHSSIMVPRAVLDTVGGYDETVRHAEDYELWLRIGTKYEIANLEDTFVLLRQHIESISSRNRLRQQWSFMRAAYTYRQAYPHFYSYLPAYVKGFILNIARLLRILL